MSARRCLFVLIALLPTVQSALPASPGSCGKTTACWHVGIDDECSKKDDGGCTARVAWKAESGGKKLRVTITALDEEADLPAYVAVGFSQDAFMGDDTVAECVWESASSGAVAAFISYNKEDVQYNDRLSDASKKLVSAVSGSRKDGLLECAFTLTLSDQSVDKDEAQHLHDLSTGTWRLLYAQGPLSDDNQKEFHTRRGAAPTKDDVRLGDASVQCWGGL